MTFVDLHILSSFRSPLTLNSFEASPPDARFVFAPLYPGKTPVIHPEALTHIGELSFEPHRGCHPDCYTGFSLDDSRGQPDPVCVVCL